MEKLQINQENKLFPHDGSPAGDEAMVFATKGFTADGIHLGLCSDEMKLQAAKGRTVFYLRDKPVHEVAE